jgi:glycosyltransferase involved in cell wall biosynthesis
MVKLAKLRKLLRSIRRNLTRERLFQRLEAYLLPPMLAKLLAPKRPALVSGADPAAFERRLEHLKRSIWMGFSRTASEQLKDITLDPKSTPFEVYRAASILGFWHSSHGRYDLALGYASLMRVAHEPITFDHDQLFLEADSWIAVGRPDRARELLEPHVSNDLRIGDVDLAFAYANTFSAFHKGGETSGDEKRLAIINSVLARRKLAPIERRDPEKPLSLDNIRCRVERPSSLPGEQPCVTVIVPAYRAAKTLPTTIRGLLEQTWQNLQIIIVDDQSPDETFAIAEEFAKADSRILAIQQQSNSGSYAGRNLALQHARGEFVTTHDSDDWSHAQKIEIQASHLTKHSHVQANITYWARCFEHLFFRTTARRTSRHVSMNHSSLMVRRALLDEAGFWDEVRIASDAEFMARVEAHAGRRSARLLADVPLSFALESDTSLTRHSATHVFTIFHGVRRVYHESARYWRDQFPDKKPRLPQTADGPRPFPAPALMLPSKAPTPEFDIIFISDLGMIGGAFVSTRNYIEAAIALGHRVAIFHYPRFDLNPERSINLDLQRLVHAGKLYRISPGESVKATCVIFGYPVVLRDHIDLPPKIECSGVAIITNQMNARLYSGGDVQYDPLTLSSYARELFNHAPIWIPISDLVRTLMEKDGRYAPIHSATWTPLIDTKVWCRDERTWQGERRPVVGRHGRDHYTKWPTDAESIRGAYCANRNCDVKLLGGAKHALQALGETPNNWRIFEFGSLDVQEYLRGLDFYVHYPHEDYIEEFGRAVLEAMAVGVPVILPEVFRPTFGEAALYAAPGDVWRTISDIWSDEESWLARVAAGRRFVLEHGDWTHFESRLAGLLESVRSKS